MFLSLAGKYPGITTCHRESRSSYVKEMSSVPKDIFVKQTWNPQFSTTVPNLEEVERQAIATAIRQNDGNLTATAEQLGISRQTLYNKIKRFKL